MKTTPPPSATPVQTAQAPIDERVNALLAQMTLAEKIGQMTQAERVAVTPEQVAELSIGSVLSGGSGAPQDSTVSGWLSAVTPYIEAALQSRLGIPLLYGVDAVHGHGNLYGAVVFPHNIGLGAARDPELVARIARAAALETAATGARWNFAPTVAVPQDLRWGRTYEGFAEEPDLVSVLGAAYVRGAQGAALSPNSHTVVTPKHYAGDGGARWGTSTMVFRAIPNEGHPEACHFQIDQGDTRLDEAAFRALHIAPYVAAIEAGAQIIMASFSSWNGEKLHGHHYLLTELLKGELGFDGFVVSDWMGIDQVDPDYYTAVVKAVNAGVDMAMAPPNYLDFISALTRAAEHGDVSEARIDDAVRRILTVKFRLGLFEQPLPDPNLAAHVGSREHRALGREAVARSLVLLKNEGVLPLSKSLPVLLVAGHAADDIGLQCGGWTAGWQGRSGPVTPGTTILDAIQDALPERARVIYAPDGDFEEAAEHHGLLPRADVAVVVVAEPGCAEGFGDRADLSLPAADVALIRRVRRHCDKLVLLLMTGRPVIITEQLPLLDALVAAWWPGTEGGGIADVLFGDRPFTGKLSFTWPRSMEQIPCREVAPPDPLFPYGYGLT